MCDKDTLHEKILASITEANNIQTNDIKKYINEEILTLKEIINAEDKKRTELEHKYEQLKKKCDSLEKQLRKNKIIIFGIECEDNVNEPELLEATTNVLNHCLGLRITEGDINNIYTVGKHNKPIVVEFISFLRKSEILKNCKKLKGTKISISEVLSIEERKTNQILRQHLKQAREKKLNAYIRKGKLYIEKEEYTAEELLKQFNINKEKDIGSKEATISTLTGGVPIYPISQEINDTEELPEDHIEERRQEVKKYKTRGGQQSGAISKILVKRAEKDAKQPIKSSRI